MFLAVALAALLVISGCTGTAPAPEDGPSDGTTTTVTTTTVACSATPEYPDVTVERPDKVTAATGKRVAETYEEQYRRHALREGGNLSYYNYIPHETEVESTDEGYRVVLDYAADYGYTGGENGTAYHAKQPFTVRYTVGERRLVREGRTVACW